MSEDLHGMHKIVDTGAVPGLWYTKPFTPPAPTIQPISFLKPEVHPKKWGAETWVINTSLYCQKILDFKVSESFSNHYHWNKDETWYVLEGQLRLDYFDLSNADEQFRDLFPGDVIHIPPGNPHKLTAIKNSRVLEVSTTHDERDSYRIGKGSSQS